MAPSHPHPKPEDEKKGRRLEECSYQELCKWRAKGLIVSFSKPDWMIEMPDGRYEAMEFKCAERFHAPPFDGQGMPVTQADNYRKLYEFHGIACRFYVKEPETGSWVWQYVHTLDEGRSFTTNGTIKTPRVIWDIASFNVTPPPTLWDIEGFDLDE